MRVAIVHDYLTQQGGAERVVLMMRKAFPDAPIYTSLYWPDGTFPEFREADIRTALIDRVALFRRHHRLALPLYPHVFERIEVDADVVLCSSSGWAHGVRTTGRKLVYCYTPARWVYRPNEYLGGTAPLARAALRAMRSWLERRDREAAASADRYLTLSTSVRQRIRDTYGIDADVLPPPPALRPEGPSRPVPDTPSPFLLCVSRLLAYKNVDAVVRAFADLSDLHLVVTGTGPDDRRLRQLAPENVRFFGNVTDDQLRWLHAESVGLVSASHEDYGLTILEAAGFGRPVATLRDGGFLDTVVEGSTGLFFDSPEPGEIATTVRELTRTTWDSSAITDHAASFSEERFVSALRRAVAELT